MNFRWLIPLGALFSLNAWVAGDGLPPTAGLVKSSASRLSAGYLLLPKDMQDGAFPSQLVPYEPEPGDILLFNMHSKFYHVVFKLVNSGSPMHTAMVIAREDGTPALLELTGPTVMSAKVVVLDVEPRLSTYPGDVMVRRIRRPLNEEQSHALTCFARSQAGKGFAMRRILLFATPFNPRCGLRRTLFGHTYFDRNRWFCSEMVVSAGTSARLFNPHIHHANATLPRDLAFDERMDLSDLYHPVVPWTADSSSLNRS